MRYTTIWHGGIGSFTDCDKNERKDTTTEATERRASNRGQRAGIGRQQRQIAGRGLTKADRSLKQCNE